MFDIIVRISYPIENPENTTIKTNAKRKVLEEIISDWLYDQIGKGADTNKANQESVYEIEIRLDLSSGCFTTTGNTGNDSLTAGIVRDLLSRLDTVPYSSL
jgi:hypothetical protein